MRNDLERAVDTVLSGLATTPEQRQRILQAAMAEENSINPPLRHKFTVPRLLIPRAVLVGAATLLMLLLPLLPQPEEDPFERYSSEDGQSYYVTGDPGMLPNAGAIADPGNYVEATYCGTSFEEAEKAYQSPLPRITWLPEGAVLERIEIGTYPEVRDAAMKYNDPYILLHILEYVNGEMGLLWVPQDQEGEYMTLSNGQEIYVTTNHGMYSISWQKGYAHYGLYTDASLEDALRMVESIR